MAKHKIKFDTFLPMFPGLIPTKSLIPKWYKESPTHANNKPAFLPNNSATMKACIPFMDAMTSGYCITLAGDVLVEQVDGLPYFTWGEHPLVATRKAETMGKIPTPSGFSKSHFAWKSWVSLELPKGYSALFTHPLNRFDLPFITLSGIVDDYIMPKGEIPFYIQEGFEGLLPQGTPIAQIIPFKRENWTSQREEGLYIKGELNSTSSNLLLSGWYKKNIWKRKSYE